jgi:peptidyl-prolyl cis-trans isomerase D
MAGNDKKTGYRILLGVVVVALGGSMLLYLVPQAPGTGQEATDTLARVGGQAITVADVRQQLAEASRNNPIDKRLEGFYAQQVLSQMIFEKELEYEAKRLDITVTSEEMAERIRQILPTAFNGGTPVDPDQYAAQVQARFSMSYQVFENLLRQELLLEKFRKLVTDGISVGPAELQQEFAYRNEKVKVAYAFVKPEDLTASITPDDAELKAAYEKSKAKYMIPERRSVRYGLLDTNQLRASVQVSDEQVKTQYQANLPSYQVPNRVHVQHILFMTVGNKTDAEIEETRKKAEDVLKQVKKGGKFDELAKKYSADPGSRDKGGDLGWIIEGQTVPEFQKVAFSLGVGQVSDVVKTQYGFHIIKVLEKESAHTKPLEEVKDSIRAPLLNNEVDKQASEIAGKLSAAIRQSSKVSLDELASQYHLTLGETRPISATDPLLELANSEDVKDQIFRLPQGGLSLPIRTDRGYVIVSVKQIQPAHQGTLEEVRDKVVADVKLEKASQLARNKADDLVKRVKGGEKFESAARALGLEPKLSDLLARNGTIPAAVSGKQLAPAFQMKVGEVGTPLSMGANWFAYQVVDKQQPNAADFEKQKKEIADSLLQNKRALAFDAFRSSLDARLKKDGELKLLPQNLKSFGGFS